MNLVDFRYIIFSKVVFQYKVLCTFQNFIFIERITWCVWCFIEKFNLGLIFTNLEALQKISLHVDNKLDFIRRKQLLNVETHKALIDKETLYYFKW